MNPAASAGVRPRAVSLPRIAGFDLGLAGVTVAAAALRFSTLGVQSFWKDEGVTVVRILRPGLGATLSAIPHSEATPPLYYFVAWFWTRVFGTSEVGIRSLSALIGVATVPVVYFAAERIVSRRAALTAAALTAFSPYLIWYSQEARAYALFAFLSALSFLLFLRVRQQRRGYVAWAAVCALAFATHYFAIFVVGAEAVWLLWEQRANRRLIGSLAGMAVVGAALLPLALHQERNGHDGWIHRLTLSGRVGNTVKFFLVGPSGTPSALLPLLAGAIVVVALWMLVTIAEPDEKRGAAVAAVVAAAIVGVPLLLYLVGEDFFFHRNVIGAWPIGAIVVGTGLAARRARLVGPALAAILCAVFLVAVVAVDTNARYQRADWRSAAHALSGATLPRAIVTPSLGDEPLEYYLGHRTALTHGAVSLRELDLLGWPLANEREPHAPAGMRLLLREKVGALTLIRYRATAPVRLDTASLAALHLGSDHPGVLLTPISK